MAHNDNGLIKLETGSTIGYRSLLNKLATSLFAHTSVESMSGNMITDFSELEGEHDLREGFITKEFAEDISERVQELYGEMVAEIEVEEDAFDLTLYDSFVCGYTECDSCLDDDEEEDEEEEE